MNKILHEINFNNIIKIKNYNSNYSFNEYINNKGHLLEGFCTSCEDKKCNIAPNDPNFRLQNISHGSSTDNFLIATKNENIDTNNWIFDGIIFLFESPSKDYDLYVDINYNGIKKRPTKFWYWIEDYQDKYEYPNQFSGQKYGTLINSIIFTFKLKNCYVTNLVKCGLNDDKDNYLGLAEYNEDCIYNCYELFLKNEIKIINPKIIFAFGSKVFNWISYLTKNDNVIIICLPHPASRRRGVKDIFFRHLYYNLCLEGLYLSKLIDINNAKEYYKKFLEQANST